MIYFAACKIHLQSSILIKSFPNFLASDDFHLDYLGKPISPFSRLVEVFHDTLKLQFIRPKADSQEHVLPCPDTPQYSRRTRGCRCVQRAAEEPGNFRLWEQLERGDEMQRQLWRLQDLRDGGGLALQSSFSSLPLISCYPHHHQRNPTLRYTWATFRAITSDWSKHKHSLGTQNLLLYIAYVTCREFGHHYPAYIVDEFLELLGNSFRRTARSRIDEVVQQKLTHALQGSEKFRDRLLKVITDVRALPQSL
jgi:hypothetical protein